MTYIRQPSSPIRLLPVVTVFGYAVLFVDCAYRGELRAETSDKALTGNRKLRLAPVRAV